MLLIQTIENNAICLLIDKFDTFIHLDGKADRKIVLQISEFFQEGHDEIVLYLTLTLVDPALERVETIQSSFDSEPKSAPSIVIINPRLLISFRTISTRSVVRRSKPKLCQNVLLRNFRCRFGVARID